ncbi:glutathione S-transferase family protein [Thalassotalea crassostreae]|uniref:glutathione S-transferase family protein n=1 Tax=Thalassotalea crassostreae TaxID=1763536 RepID=UPI0008393633|nr:glutathione S-transferase family protein [Thalassotalea crassostreae]
MKIFGLKNSRSFRATWAACEAGVDVKFIHVNFGSDGENGTLSDDYKNLNWQGKVPTLVDDADDNFVLTESAAIVNYIAAKGNNKDLLPTGVKERAKYDEICFFVLAELEQPLWTKGKHKFALPAPYRVPDIIDTTTPFEWGKAQTALLKLVAGSKYAAGDKFTMADILLSQTIMWAKKFEYDVDDSLVQYSKEMCQRPAFAQALAIESK